MMLAHRHAERPGHVPCVPGDGRPAQGVGDGDAFGWPVVAQRDQGNLEARIRDGQARLDRGHEGRGRDGAVKGLGPHLVEGRHLAQIGDGDIGLDHARQRGARGGERGPELVPEEVGQLQLDALAFPEMPLGHLGLRRDTPQGFCQVVEAEMLIRQAGTSPRSYPPFRRPAPCLSLRPNARIAAVSLDDSRPLTTDAVAVESVG